MIKNKKERRKQSHKKAEFGMRSRMEENKPERNIE